MHSILSQKFPIYCNTLKIAVLTKYLCQRSSNQCHALIFIVTQLYSQCVMLHFRAKRSLSLTSNQYWNKMHLTCNSCSALNAFLTNAFAGISNENAMQVYSSFWFSPNSSHFQDLRKTEQTEQNPEDLFLLFISPETQIKDWYQAPRPFYPPPPELRHQNPAGK